LEKNRIFFLCDLLSLCSKEGDLCDQIINNPELSGFDPFADTFLNVHIEFVDLPEEIGKGVGFLGATELYLKLCPPKNVVEFKFGVKANVRARPNEIVPFLG
jgi:hypothetical protein